MKHILFSLAVAMLVLLNACTENYTMNDDPLFADEIHVESNYGSSDYYYSHNDYAIGGTSHSIFSDPPKSEPMGGDYGDYGSYGQASGGGGGGGGGMSSSSVQLNMSNSVGVFGGIYLNEVPQRSYPGNSYAVANQDFTPTGSGDDGFNFITQEFGTPLYTPLGSGWLILVAAGAGYALVKRRKKD